MEKTKRVLVNRIKKPFLEQLLVSACFLCTQLLGNISQNAFHLIKLHIFDGMYGI